MPKLRRKDAVKFVFAGLCIAVVGLLLAGCSPDVEVKPTANSDNRQWRFELQKAPPPFGGAVGHDAGIRFISDGGDVIALPFRAPYRIGFMKVMDESGDGKFRRFTMDFASGITDYRQYLVDMKGDGDRRHRIVCNYEGGSSAAQYQAFLIDTKDGFKIIKEIPAGECPDYTKHNPDLIFE